MGDFFKCRLSQAQGCVSEPSSGVTILTTTPHLVTRPFSNFKYLLKVIFTRLDVKQHLDMLKAR